MKAIADQKTPLTDYQFRILLDALATGRTSIYGPEIRSAYRLVRLGFGTIERVFRAHFFNINTAGRDRANARA